MKKLLHHFGKAGKLFVLTDVLLCFSAPYEICPEDYAVSMVWRRTPSGELAFNRCPPNATGEDMSNIFHFSIHLLLSLPGV